MGDIVRLPSQLGAIIQSERQRRDLTQQDLANLTGTLQKTISAIENGSPGTRLETLLTVIAHLGLDIKLVPRDAPTTAIEDIF